MGTVGKDLSDLSAFAPELGAISGVLMLVGLFDGAKSNFQKEMDKLREIS